MSNPPPATSPAASTISHSSSVRPTRTRTAALFELETNSAYRGRVSASGASHTPAIPNLDARRAHGRRGEFVLAWATRGVAEIPMTPDDESGPRVHVPASIVDAAVIGLRAGAEAILDRDWELFTPDEQLDAERFARETCHAPADALVALQLKHADQIG